MSRDLDSHHLFFPHSLFYLLIFFKSKNVEAHDLFFWKIVKRAQKIRKERIICLRLCVRGNFIFVAKHNARWRQSVCPSVVLRQTSTKTPLKGVVDIFFYLARPSHVLGQNASCYRPCNDARERGENNIYVLITWFGTSSPGRCVRNPSVITSRLSHVTKS